MIINLFILISVALISVCCATGSETTLPIVPYPNFVEVKSGTFNVAGAEFYCDESIDSASINVIRKFAGQLSFVTGKESVMYDGISSSGFNFYLDTTLAKEAYNIEIGSKCVIVKASSLNGYNYAVQTIKQMLPPQIFGTCTETSFLA